MSSYEETYLKERSQETTSDIKKILSKQKHYVQSRD